MNININILEDNKQDYYLLSESIGQWASAAGHIVHITWINSYCSFSRLLPTLNCDIFFSDIELKCSSIKSQL